ncbi:Hsp20/alpha crystallin family protein, partial [Thermococci archaeon]
SEVKPEHAKATYKDGILTITIPKSEKAKPKEIEIEVK